MLVPLAVAWLAKAHATPPPPRPDSAPRIEGLQQTFVTPSTFVPSLRPDTPLDGPAAVLVVVHDDTVELPALMERLSALPDVEHVTARERTLAVAMTVAHDLSSTPIDEAGRTLADVASLRPAVGPVPVKLPPAGGVVPPSGPTKRPFPPPPVIDEATGWDLVFTNPHLGGPSRISVSGLAIGDANPDATIVLHDVAPGRYVVAFRTHTGAERQRLVATVRADTDDTAE